MSFNDESSIDDVIDFEELVISLKSTTSGLTSSTQLIDTTSNAEISFDSTSFISD